MMHVQQSVSRLLIATSLALSLMVGILSLPIMLTNVPHFLSAPSALAAGGISVTVTTNFNTVYQGGLVSPSTFQPGEIQYTIIATNGTGATINPPFYISQTIPTGTVCTVTDNNGNVNWIHNQANCASTGVAQFNMASGSWLSGTAVILKFYVTPDGVSGSYIDGDNDYSQYNVTTSGVALHNPGGSFNGGVAITDPASTVVTVDAPVWQISQSASPSVVNAGDWLTYTVNITNSGVYSINPNVLNKAPFINSVPVTITKILPAEALITSVSALSFDYLAMQGMGYTTFNTATRQITWVINNSTFYLNPGSGLPQPLLVNFLTSPSLPHNSLINSNTVYVQGSDNVYRSASGASVNVTVQNLSPVIPLNSATVSGPTTGLVNTLYNYSVITSPISATTPISYTWNPAPSSGQGTPNVQYSWPSTGVYPITATISNANSTIMAYHSISVADTLYLHVNVSVNTTVANVGDMLTYTVTITNDGPISVTGYLQSSHIPSLRNGNPNIVLPVGTPVQLIGTHVVTEQDINESWGQFSEMITILAPSFGGPFLSFYSNVVNVTLPLPPHNFSISGPSTGLANTNYVFTPVFSPTSAPSPYYIWGVEPDGYNGTGEPLTYNFYNEGVYTITLTAVHSPNYEITATHIITITALPPTNVAISGPSTGLVNTDYVFTATISPISATSPIYYNWSPTPLSTTGLGDTATYNFANTGPQLITVVAYNNYGTVTNTTMVDISQIIPTPTTTPTVTPTVTVTPTATVTTTTTPTATTTVTPTITVTPTATVTTTTTPTATVTVTPTQTVTPTTTVTTTATPTVTVTVTPTVTITPTATVTVTATPTATVTVTPTATATPMPNKADLTGQVTSAADNQPISGLYVQLYQWTGQWWNWAASSQTDSQGQYQLRNLAPNSHYALCVYDWQSWPSRYLNQCYDNASQLDQATHIALSGGESRIINLALQNPGRITGVIHDPNGQPVSGLSVQVMRQSSTMTSPNQSGWDWAGWAQTNPNGFYEVSGLTTGQYRVQVSDWRWPNREYASKYYQNSTDPAQATPVNVTTGQTTANIDITLDGPGQISGKVTNKTNQAIANIYVYAVQWNGSWWNYSGYALTDANGQYQLKGLNGTYRLAFYDSAWPRRYIEKYYLNGTSFETGSDVQVTVGQTVTADVTLTKASKLMGQVTNHLNQPAANIFVKLFRQSSVSGTWQIVDWGTSTDSNGQYQFTGLGAGKYRVGFFSDWQSEAIGYYDGATTIDAATSIDVTTGATTIGVDFQLPVPTPPLADVTIANGNVSVDRLTGQTTVQLFRGSAAPITVTKVVTCDNGTTPTQVTLNLNSVSYPMQESPTGSGKYHAIIPADEVTTGSLYVSKTCGGVVTGVKIGSITFYDPAGNITDSITGDNIQNAKVTLYNVPGWHAKQGAGDNTPNTCESHLSKDVNIAWSQAAPITQGIMALAQSGTFTPAINPLISDNVGRYQWDVTEGCWYVVVQADGYQTKTSAVVGVPPAVTDLNVALTPLPTFRFTALDYEVTANVNTAVITVTSGLAVTANSTVDYVITNDAGEQLATGTLTFNVGQTQQTFTVNLTQVSSDTHLNLTLTKATGTGLGLQTEAVVSRVASATQSIYLPIVVRK